MAVLKLDFHTKNRDQLQKKVTFLLSHADFMMSISKHASEITDGQGGARVRVEIDSTNSNRGRNNEHAIDRNTPSHP